MTGRAAPPHVSVRAMILALSRFEIASGDKAHVLERDWATYRKNHRLLGEGKLVAEMAGDLSALRLARRTPELLRRAC